MHWLSAEDLSATWRRELLLHSYLASRPGPRTTPCSFLTPHPHTPIAHQRAFLKSAQGACIQHVQAEGVSCAASKPRA
jgi:hypothetical protein